jgi:hypothetical protein
MAVRLYRNTTELPKPHRILPKMIDLNVPGFEWSCAGAQTLSIAYDDCQ